MVFEYTNVSIEKSVEILPFTGSINSGRTGSAGSTIVGFGAAVWDGVVCGFGAVVIVWGILEDVTIGFFSVFTDDSAGLFCDTGGIVDISGVLRLFAAVTRPTVSAMISSTIIIVMYKICAVFCSLFFCSIARILSEMKLYDSSFAAKGFFYAKFCFIRKNIG